MPTPASWMAGVISDWDSPDDKDGELFYKRKGVLPISLIPDSCPYLRSCHSVARFHYLQWLLCVIWFNIYTEHTSTPVQRKRDAGTAGGCPVQAGTAGGCPVQVNWTFCVN